MAGEKNLLNQLRRQARGFDEAMLEALANRGLLRRARKDFASGEIAINLEISDEKLIKLRVAEAVVSFSEKGLTQGVCDCPSTEVCRHILLACFWLAEKVENDENAAPETAEISTKDEKPEKHLLAEWLEISLAELEKKTGKKAFAQGAEFLLKNEVCTFEQTSNELITAEFPDSGISIRLLSQADLSVFLCSCRASEICRHRVAAILALRRENGREFLPAVENKTAESSLRFSEAQIRVLKKTETLFREFVEIGIAHLSESSIEQLQTLATSAGGASLFRLSFALKNLADGLSLSIKRSARADETAWLVFLAKTYALASALLAAETPNLNFIGTSRSAYEEIGQLDVAGVGAYQWQTLSGFQGLTALFWDERGKRFFSWTDARPLSDKSFSPVNAFSSEMRWQGVATPDQAASSVFRLQNAQRNNQNRLSGSASIQAFVKGETEIEKIDFAGNDFSAWKDLRRYFADIAPAGLKERRQFKEFAVVRPAQFGQRFFDQIKQIFVWQLYDSGGDSIQLKVPFTPFNEAAISALEKVDSAEIKGILARLATDFEGVYLQPISLFLTLTEKGGKTRIFHLNLSNQKSENAKIADRKNEEENALEEEEFSIENLSVSGIVPQKLEETREILQRVAESGTKSFQSRWSESLFSAAKSLESTGLSALGVNIRDFTKSPDKELPAKLLKLIFLTRLALEIVQIQRLSANK